MRMEAGKVGDRNRTVICRDKSKNWLDEVNYVDSKRLAGIGLASVVLEVDNILTITGSSQSGNRLLRIEIRPI